MPDPTIAQLVSEIEELRSRLAAADRTRDEAEAALERERRRVSVLADRIRLPSDLATATRDLAAARREIAILTEAARRDLAALESRAAADLAAVSGERDAAQIELAALRDQARRDLAAERERSTAAIAAAEARAAARVADLERLLAPPSGTDVLEVRYVDAAGKVVRKKYAAPDGSKFRLLPDAVNHAAVIRIMGEFGVDRDTAERLIEGRATLQQHMADLSGC